MVITMRGNLSRTYVLVNLDTQVPNLVHCYRPHKPYHPLNHSVTKTQKTHIYVLTILYTHVRARVIIRILIENRRAKIQQKLRARVAHLLQALCG
jgi:hypothetical protein